MREVRLVVGAARKRRERGTEINPFGLLLFAGVRKREKWKIAVFAALMAQFPCRGERRGGRGAPGIWCGESSTPEEYFFGFENIECVETMFSFFFGGDSSILVRDNRILQLNVSFQCFSYMCTYGAIQFTWTLYPFFDFFILLRPLPFSLSSQTWGTSGGYPLSSTAIKKLKLENRFQFVLNEISSPHLESPPVAPPVRRGPAESPAPSRGGAEGEEGRTLRHNKKRTCFAQRPGQDF